MPPLEVTDLHDDAVLWLYTGWDNFGDFAVGDPIQIKCRWVDGQSEALDAGGNTIALDATVIVTRDIPIGSVMAKGTLEEWGIVGTGVTDELGPVWEVKTFNSVKDLKNRFTRRSVGLMRYKHALPTLVDPVE